MIIIVSNCNNILLININNRIDFINKKKNLITLVKLKIFIFSDFTINI